MEPVTTAVGAAGMKALIAGLVAAIPTVYEKAKRKHLEHVLGEWGKNDLGEKIYAQADQARFVKTLWRVDEKLDLMDFFTQPYASFREERIRVENASSFDESTSILIVGTVGQGKSMLLRYLAIRELTSPQRVPVLVEMRSLTATESLLEHIVERMEKLGLRGVDQEIFEHLATRQQVLLLLDGFDEIPGSEVARRIQEVGELALRYSGLRIIASSRPGTGIETLPLLKTYSLCPLRGKEYQVVLRRLVANDEVTEQILKEVAGKIAVELLLTTPLMVTLLAVQYRAECRVPHDVVGFFRGLFGLLLYGHDRAKQGYRRGRKSGLGDTLLENVFNAFCFLLAKEARGQVHDRNTMVKFAARALATTGQSASADDFLDDIVEITCLVLFEGGQGRFVHKSVQEFHTACFIENLSDVKAEKFYGAMVADSGSVWIDWRQELAFLKHLDPIRFRRFAFLPDSRRLLSRLSGLTLREAAAELFADSSSYALPGGVSGLVPAQRRSLLTPGKTDALHSLPARNSLELVVSDRRMHLCLERMFMRPPLPANHAALSHIACSKNDAVPYPEIVKFLSECELIELGEVLDALKNEVAEAEKLVVHADELENSALDGF